MSPEQSFALFAFSGSSVIYTWNSKSGKFVQQVPRFWEVLFGDHNYNISISLTPPGFLHLWRDPKSNLPNVHFSDPEAIAEGVKCRKILKIKDSHIFSTTWLHDGTQMSSLVHVVGSGTVNRSLEHIGYNMADGHNK